MSSNDKVVTPEGITVAEALELGAHTYGQETAALKDTQTWPQPRAEDYRERAERLSIDLSGAY